MTERRPAIVVVGSYMRDTIFRTTALPRPGETIAASGVAVGHGGKGSNQAVQAARCGGATTLIAALGDDPAGYAARELWAAESIGQQYVTLRAGEVTGMAFVTVDEAGENQIVVAAGANGALAPGDVEGAADHLAGAAVVLAQLETPIPTAIRAFELARRGGAMTVLNATPLDGAETLGRLLSVTDLIVCNLGEAQTLLGHVADDPALLCARLAVRVNGAALVTAGAEGACLCLGPDKPTLRQPAIAPHRIVDTTGAGDAFIGALLCRWVETRDWAQALRFAAAAGAIACETLGAVGSFATRSAILQRLN